ncbi:MAG: alpha/beta fold hydrolase [Planctomycetota bacterium]|jgi:proline iminopeptidase
MRAMAPLLHALVLALLLVGPSCSVPGLAPAQALAGIRESGLEAHVLRLPDCNLYYEVVGSGPPLVLIHGAADHRIFYPVVSQLQEKLTVILYDQRGFGRTRVQGDKAPPTTLAIDVADLDRLRATLGFERVHVLALSNGGPIAIDYALSHSHAVDRLILLDTYADNDARTVMAWPLIREVLSDPQRVERLQELADDKGLSKMDRQIGEFLTLPHTHHELPLSRAWEDHWFRSGCLGEAQDTGQAEHKSPPHRAYQRLDQLSRIEAPTLVICGEHDRITPLEHSRQMAAQLPNGRLAVIKDAGHLAFAEAPDEFVRLVHAFLVDHGHE